MSQRFRLLYHFVERPDGMPIEEVRAKVKEGYGACDAVLLAQIVYNDDGSSSTMFVSRDGRREGPLTDGEIFALWSKLAKGISEMGALDEERRKIASDAFEAVRAIILRPMDN